jgi:DNA-binding SARP family transcriptional activator
MTRGRQIATGLLAFSAVALVIGGVPWALIHFIGWPLPHTLPSWQQLRTDLTTRGIPDNTLLNGLALAVWAGWVVLTASLLNEIVAATAGRTRPALPLTGVLQPTAVLLITAISLALMALIPRPHSGGPPTSGAALRASLTATRTTQQVLAPAAGGPHALAQQQLGPPPQSVSADRVGRAPAGAPTDRSDPEGSSYVVAGRDTLWGIAQRELGDPLRWHELFTLNAGRPQPDGQTLTDPGLIRPGWTLLLPAAARPQQPPPSVPPAHRAPSEPPPRHAELTIPPGASPRSAPTPTPAPAPAPGSEPVSATPSPPDPNRSSSPSQTIATPAAAHHDHDNLADDGRVLVPASLLAGITAAGALALRHRRRRYRPLPPDRADRREPLTARLAVRATGPAPAGDPAPIGDLPTPHGQAPPTAAPPAAEPSWGRVPFAQRADGHELQQDLLSGDGLTLIGAGAAAAARSVLLTLLYRTAPEPPHTDLRLDPPTAQLPGLEGDVQLLLGDTQQPLLPDTALPAIRRGPAAAHAREVWAELGRRRAFQTERVHENSTARPAPGQQFLRLRHDCPDERLPLLVLAVQDPDPALTAELRQLARAGAAAGVTVLTVTGDPAAVGERSPAGDTHPSGAAAISVAAGGLVLFAEPSPITPAQSAVPAQAFSLSMEQSASLLRLLVGAAGGESPGEKPFAGDADRSPADSGAAAAPADLNCVIDLRSDAEPPQVATPATSPSSEPHRGTAGSSPNSATGPPQSLATIRVLGPAAVVADLTPVSGLRGKSVELLAYLACHDRGATADALAETLWPKAPSDRSRARLHTTIANIRSTLREATGYPEHTFVTLTHGRYQLQEYVIATDLRDFVEPLNQLRAVSEPETLMRLLAQAAAAFTGEPLADITADWAEPIREATRMRALDTYLTLAGLHRDRNDNRGELAVLTAARTIDPYAEEVTRQLIEAHLRAGERPAALRVFRDLEEKLADLGVDPDPATTVLITTKILTKHT